MSVVRFLPPPSLSSHHHHHHHLFFVIFFLLSPLSLSLPDDQPLLDFKASLKNTSPLDSSWVVGTSACNDKKPWLGVLCDGDKRVQSIRLSELGVSGEINVDALAKMEGLRALYLGGNALSGPIPALNKLPGLKNLYIHDNQFSGEIANDFFDKMGNLRKLWLGSNNFSGTIPESLGKLANLVELRLDDNKFSGRIPLIAQASLQSIDFSDNRLEGPVPEQMLRFGVHAFDGNEGLCGKGLENECAVVEHPEQPPDTSGGSGLKWVILGIVIALLMMTIVFKTRHTDHDYDDFHKENLDEMVPVTVSSSSSNRRSGSKKMSESGRWSRKGSQHGGRSTGAGDLVIVNDQRGLFGLQDLMKAAAEVLGNGGLGSAYKAVLATGVSVVVKRLREMNKLNKDGFDAEIRRLGKLSHPNVLTPLAYHYRKDEKLLVSEFVPKGSLLYILHGDRGISHGELNWATRLKIIQGVARGMGFLHTEFATELPHGNLKSSNILLNTNYEPLISDYAYYTLISNAQTAQSLFAFKSPEGILYQQVTPKSDVYCLGIIILEIVTGKFPAQYLNNQKGGTDLVQWVRSAISEKREIELIDPEIASTTESLDQMDKLLHIAAACTETEYQVRLDMKEATRRIEEIHV